MILALYKQVNNYLQYNRNVGEFPKQHLAELLLKNWQPFLVSLIVMRELTPSYCTCLSMLLATLVHSSQFCLVQAILLCCLLVAFASTDNKGLKYGIKLVN